MKKLLLALCLVMAVVTVVTPAFAEELWDFHLRGVNEGLAAGAVPPAGFYFINDFYWAPSYKLYGATVNGSYNSSVANSNIKLAGYVDVPVLLWSSGINLCGASYAAAILQPFDFTNLRVNTTEFTNTLTQGFNSWESGNQWGAYNTTIVPVILSWKLCDFRVKGALEFGLNDGTTSPGNSLAGGPAAGNPFYQIGGAKLAGRDGNIYAWSSNDNWQITPNVGISWLHAGWNISADLYYTWYTKDTDTNYQNGDEFSADYTITYTCGKWTFGLGSAQQNQIQNDKFNAGDGFGYISQPNTKAANYEMGPIIGYNFGPCSLMFTYNFALETQNEVGGDWCNLRLVVPLGNPCPIK